MDLRSITDLESKVNIEIQAELFDYLHTTGRIGKNTVVESRLLSGGVSNRTVQVQFQDKSSWVLKQALDQLRVEGDWFCPPERVHFEAEAMQWLHQYIPKICPKLIFEDRVQHLLAMEAVPEPFKNLKRVLIENKPQLRYFEAAGKLLGSIHSHGLQEELIPEQLFDTHFFDILRIEPYYLETIDQEKETEKFFKLLIADTSRDRYTFTHGDFSPKNLLLKDDDLILLDHEVAHFGDGTFDLGFFIAHLLSKANHRRNYMHEFLTGIQVFMKTYLEEIKEISNVREQRAIRHIIGCFLARVCGLSQLRYLNEEQQQAQRTIGLNFIETTPRSIEELIERFKKLINADN